MTLSKECNLCYATWLRPTGANVRQELRDLDVIK